MLKNRNQNNKDIETVLMVSEYYPPHWTGLSNSFHLLAQNLQKQGYKVEVLTTLFDKTTLKEDSVDGVPVTRVPYQVKISRTHYSGLILIEFIKRLKQHTTVIINSPNSNILFYSIFL